jgi:hypothetical protein
MRSGSGTTVSLRERNIRLSLRKRTIPSSMGQRNEPVVVALAKRAAASLRGYGRTDASLPLWCLCVDDRPAAGENLPRKRLINASVER